MKISLNSVSLITHTKLFCFVFSAALTYAPAAFSANYLCDIYNADKKIATLPGALPDNRSSSRTNANPSTDPNIALAYTLCQQAGFQLLSTQASIPGMRGSTSVTKIQQYPDPACILKCTLL